MLVLPKLATRHKYHAFIGHSQQDGGDQVAHIKKELLDKMRAELTILGFVAFSATILLQVDA